MKKVLLAALMVYGLSLASCDKGSEVAPESKLVDVTLSSESTDVESRTLVTPDGVTRWDVADEVFIVDTDQSLRMFKYSGTSASANGQFKGQLLGGQGAKTYYAYYGLNDVNCSMGANHLLAIKYQDLNKVDSRSADFGKCCPMVAVPSAFDAESATKPGLQFHHAASLVEASVSCSGECDLNDVNFDKVVFELRAKKGYENSFNSKVTIDLTKIKGGSDVTIPYTESSDKCSVLTTTLSYSTVQNLGTLVSSSQTGGFNIPIYALPTTADFLCEATITFSSGGKVTCILYNDGPTHEAGFKGLNPSGLNVLNFNETHIVQ